MGFPIEKGHQVNSPGVVLGWDAEIGGGGERDGGEGE